MANTTNNTPHTTNDLKRVALITGITGQDGSYLAELLLQKNYIVHGIIRRSSTINTDRIDHIFNNENLYIHYGDLMLQNDTPDDYVLATGEQHTVREFIEIAFSQITPTGI